MEIETWTQDIDSQQSFLERTKIRIGATVDSSRSHLNAFLKYVRGTWEDHDPVVLLVEEGTSFGAGVTNFTTSSQKDESPVYIVKFPRGISKLGNATETKERIPGFAEQTKTPEQLRRELPFVLGEQTAGNSEVPFYSTEQSPISQESILFNVASLLKKGMLHHAGVVATDPLDVLFLAKFLRASSPNTHLFILGGDLLFEHGADSRDYEGILSVTNYPLFSFNQIWTDGKSKPIQIFADSTSEAVSNAVAFLLSNLRGEQPDSGLREYGDPPATGTEPAALVDGGWKKRLCTSRRTAGRRTLRIRENEGESRAWIFSPGIF